MKAVLDLDDFSVLRSRMDLLEQLHDHYPKFKISLFTIVADVQYEKTDLRLMREEVLKRIHKNLDWMQFIPHGLTHMPEEFLRCDRETMEMYLDNIESEFDKLGLPMTKGFKAPFWLWNQDVVDALDDRGWFGGVDPNQPRMLRTKKYYEYTDSIDTDFLKSTNNPLLLHGHMTPPSRNDLDSCFLNLTRLPINTEWCFVTDFIKEK